MKHLYDEKVVEQTPKIKQTIETYWARTLVRIEEGLSPVDRFFQKEHHGCHFIIRPEDIDFKELTKFEGKKTRVTIEVIE